MSVLATLIPRDKDVERAIKQAEEQFRRKIPRYGDDNAPYPFNIVPQWLEQSSSHARTPGRAKAMLQADAPSEARERCQRSRGLV